MSIEEEVLDWVADYFGIPVGWITGHRRKPQALLLEARRTVAWILRRGDWSYPAIGAALNKDHTTVMYYLRDGWSPAVDVPSRLCGPTVKVYGDTAAAVQEAAAVSGVSIEEFLLYAAAHDLRRSEKERAS